MSKCIICSSKNIKSIYHGFLRNGSFGKFTDQMYDVCHCEDCKITYIQNILPSDYYETPEYRNDYNNSIDIANFYKEYDDNDTNKINKIKLYNLRDKVIADFGTAAGTFLQAIVNISKYTIAIEPTKYFHENLQRISKYVFPYGKELVESGLKIDVATSFDVIEHVPVPIEYLKEIYESLLDGGKLYLKTPNFNDVLHELIPENYDSFNYRTAHLYYFDKESIKYILEQAGFLNFTIGYIHDYDISNLLYWMKEQKPTGLGRTEIFDDGFNLMYKNYLERNGKASHLWIEAIK